MSIGNNILNLRKEKNITQTDLANTIGVGKTTISNYETGYSTPDAEMIKKLAEYFRVTTDHLLGNEPLDPQNINPLTSKKMTKREISQYERVTNEANLMFDDEDVSEDDKEKLMMALNDMFWKAKQKNKEKYAKSHTKKDTE